VTEKAGNATDPDAGRHSRAGIRRHFKRPSVVEQHHRAREHQ
jgi:hypothetical protein